MPQDGIHQERSMCPHVSLAETWDCLVLPWKQRYGSPSCHPRTLGDIRRQARETLEDRFPRVWVPSPENRDLRQLLWHRHRLVQIRTRIINQLQAVAMNEGVRRRAALWSKSGRTQLESLPLAPWAARRRHDLLELLDRLNPRIEELNAAVEQRAQQRPERLDASLGRR